MKNSRKNIILSNVLVSFGCQITNIILAFIVRTVFVYTLGKEYLGINGLFTDILTILSFAELGVGSAIVYRLYEPVSKGDYIRVQQYLKLFKIIYRIILIVILTFGLALVPFIHLIVEAPNVSENLVVLYLLYLAQTVTSYICVYKKSVLIADQKQYLVSIITQITLAITNVLQCIFLYVTHNFIIYCLLHIASSIVANIVCSKIAEHRYPYICEDISEKLSSNDIGSLKTDVKGLLMTNIAGTIFTGTDNIFISRFIGISYVGILSNYTLILASVNAVMNKVFSSITASIGTIALEGDYKQTKDIMQKMIFVNNSMYCLICVGMMLLVDEFVTKIWFSADYGLTKPVILIAVFEMFVRSIHYPIYTTRNALGLFSQYKALFVIFAIVNIVLDFLFVKPLGIFGLFLSTVICRGVIYLSDVYVVYRIGLNCSMIEHLRILFKWFAFLFVNTLLGTYILQFVTFPGITGFVLKVVVVVVLYSVLYFAAFCKDHNFKFFSNLLLMHSKK